MKYDKVTLSKAWKAPTLRLLSEDDLLVRRAIAGDTAFAEKARGRSSNSQ